MSKTVRQQLGIDPVIKAGQGPVSVSNTPDPNFNVYAAAQDAVDYRQRRWL
jgi:hypothetical protein